MSAKKGQKSAKATTLPRRYRDGMLDVMDNRVEQVRRVRSRYHQLIRDKGGDDQVSYAMRSLLLRFACLEGWLSREEQKMLLGEPFDEHKYFAALSPYIGMITRIGLKRVPKELPTLQQYLSNGVRPDDADKPSSKAFSLKEEEPQE